ncbi:dolichyl-P-Man:Man(7)GlcNAc(2)-PP-dolichol alpha-1,6-mannosyltransferase [Irineochytrium annulatum]|nr:dolichyl-P-Man:Man(7)GlcNAc(2)-PP-dolichol alpha-1,6-mannosyltransferase [Irineochytrium annulatum]
MATSKERTAPAASPAAKAPAAPASKAILPEPDHVVLTAGSSGRPPLLAGDLGDLLTLALMVYYAHICPYTKVEESFNMQATHDLIVHTPGRLDLFDHLEFPGVVPRTFLGPLGLYLLTQIPVSVLQQNTTGDLTPDYYMYIVRVAMALATAHSLRTLRQVAERVFGLAVSGWFVAFNLAQFHLMFWGSRTLPNVLGMVVMNWCLAAWINGFKVVTEEEKRVEREQRKKSPLGAPPVNFTKGMQGPSRRKDAGPVENYMDNGTMGYLFLGTFACLVFRLELVALFGTIVLSEFVRGKVNRFRYVVVLVISAALSLGSTLLADSFFWRQEYFWPESHVFAFNVVENKSGEYGVHPPYHYVLSLLPRIAPVSYPFAIYSAINDPRIRRLLLPACTLVAALSVIPHKEWRFVIYLIPLLNLSAAAGLTRSIRLAALGRSRISGLIAALVLMALAASLAASQVMLHISAANYPAGVALKALHRMAWPNQAPDGWPSVHIDSGAAQSGITRFQEVGRDKAWTYHKDEGLKTTEEFLKKGYTHLVTTEPELHLKGGEDAPWVMLGAIRGYDSVKMWDEGLEGWAASVVEDVSKGKVEWMPQRLIFGVRLPFEVVLKPKVWLLQKKGWSR